MQITPQILLAAIALGLSVGSAIIALSQKTPNKVLSTIGFSGIPVCLYLAYHIAMRNQLLTLVHENTDMLFLYPIVVAAGCCISVLSCWGHCQYMDKLQQTSTALPPSRSQ